MYVIVSMTYNYKQAIGEILSVFSNYIGRPIHSVMEYADTTDEDFGAVFEALAANGVPNDNNTIITKELLDALAALNFAEKMKV